MLLLHYNFEILACDNVNKISQFYVTKKLIIGYIDVTLQLCYEKISGGFYIF
jgi:hypothetical protein